MNLLDLLMYGGVIFAIQLSGCGLLVAGRWLTMFKSTVRDKIAD